MQNDSHRLYRFFVNLFHACFGRVLSRRSVRKGQPLIGTYYSALLPTRQRLHLALEPKKLVDESLRIRERGQVPAGNDLRIYIEPGMRDASLEINREKAVMR